MSIKGRDLGSVYNYIMCVWLSYRILQSKCNGVIGLGANKSAWNNTTAYAREQEKEEDMEQIHHWGETARCVKTLLKEWKKKEKSHQMQKCTKSARCPASLLEQSVMCCHRLTVSVHTSSGFGPLRILTKSPTADIDAEFKNIGLDRLFFLIRPSWGFLWSYPLNLWSILEFSF